MVYAFLFGAKAHLYFASGLAARLKPRPFKAKAAFFQSQRRDLSKQAQRSFKAGAANLSEPVAISRDGLMHSLGG